MTELTDIPGSSPLICSSCGNLLPSRESVTCSVCGSNVIQGPLYGGTSGALSMGNSMMNTTNAVPNGYVYGPAVPVYENVADAQMNLPESLPALPNLPNESPPIEEDIDVDDSSVVKPSSIVVSSSSVQPAGAAAGGTAAAAGGSVAAAGGVGLSGFIICLIITVVIVFIVFIILVVVLANALPWIIISIVRSQSNTSGST